MSVPCHVERFRETSEPPDAGRDNGQLAMTSPLQHANTPQSVSFSGV